MIEFYFTTVLGKPGRKQRPESRPTWTSRGLPNLRALSRFFLKASSRKLVRVILRSLYSFMMNSVACPEGSMISGYLRTRQWRAVRGHGAHSRWQSPQQDDRRAVPTTRVVLAYP